MVEDHVFFYYILHYEEILSFINLVRLCCITTHKGAFKYYISPFGGLGALSKNVETADAYVLTL